MATLNQIVLDGDGTIDTANISHDAGTDLPYFSHCNDAPDGLSSDFIEHNGGLSTDTYDAWFSLSNVDVDFGSMDTLNIDVDVQVDGVVTGDTVILTARIFDADNDTSNPLTDETTSLGDEGDSSRVQRNDSFASLVGTEAQWNSAHIRFRYDYTAPSGDNFTLRLFGCDIDGTYTVSSSQDIFNITDGSAIGNQQIGRIRVFHPGDITLSGRNGETYDPANADLPTSKKSIKSCSTKFEDRWDDPTYYAGDLD